MKSRTAIFLLMHWQSHPYSPVLPFNGFWVFPVAFHVQGNEKEIWACIICKRWMNSMRAAGLWRAWCGSEPSLDSDLFPLIYCWTFWVSGLTGVMEHTFGPEELCQLWCVQLQPTSWQILLTSWPEIPLLYVWLFFIIFCNTFFFNSFILAVCCHWHAPPAARN